MPSREGKIEILFVLVVQIAIWSISTSLPAKSAQLSPWIWDDDDDDDFLFRRSTTRKSYIWERYTLSPDDTLSHDDEYKPSSSSVYTIVWIIAGAIFLLIFIIFLVNAFCNNSFCSTESSAYDSPTTLHPPPGSIIPPQNRPTQNTGNSNIPVGGAQYNFTAWSSSGLSSTQNAVDKPPGYSVVVMSDLTEDSAKFPDVCPQPLETPPPKYDNQNLLRF